MPRQFGQRASVVVSTHARSDSSLVNSWDAVLGHLRTGWFAQVSNGAAGLANPGAMGRTLGQGLRWLNGVQMRRPCFPGEVQVLTRRGWVRWDGLRAGDEVLSLPEDEPEGELAYRPVEEVFQRWGVIWEVAVGGRLLRTTAEHPFWVRGRGWTAASQLRVGDALRSHDGQWLAVEVSARHGPRGGGVQLPSGGVSYLLRRR
jgi:hypothetical protein